MPRRFGGGKGDRGHRRKVAYMASWDDEPDDDEPDDDGGDDDDDGVEDNVCYMCVTSGVDADFNGVIDRIKQGVCAAFLCAGCDLDDQEVCQDPSECAQDALFAFFSREGAIKRGVKVDREVHNYRPTSELTSTDRRANVNQAKRNSKCRKRGKTSHWAGDKACQMRDQPDGKDKGKGTRRKG